MIKLNKLYSSDEEVFPTITFVEGINVVFASVSNNKSKSSHSLGKTTLVDIIDFCFLKKVVKGSVLRNERLSGQQLFLELKLGKDKYLTIKRVVSGKISIVTTTTPCSMAGQPNIPWGYTNLSFDKAKEVLNGLICPSLLTESGFHFRSGLRYCLRKQTNYEETFKVRAGQEPNASWVPYLGSILGIDAQSINEKFEANKRVDALDNAIKQIKDLPTDSSQSLEAEITRIEATVTKMKITADSFDFKTSDEVVSKELVNEVSTRVSSLTKELYSIDQKILAINKSLLIDFYFDLEKTLELFEEVKIHFPEGLKRSYEDLISVNEEMTKGRKSRLIQSKKEIVSYRVTLEGELNSEREKQQKLSQLLLQKDVFKKYKELQNKISKEESRVATLKEKLKRLDLVGTLDEKLEEAKSEKRKKGRKLEPATKLSQNEILKSAVTIFSGMAENILDLDAFFYVELNKEGNLQFDIQLKNQTSINEGFSYTRVLSAIFDVTLLLIHSKVSFYRFCYHDGLLESLDDRIKVKLIKLWREISNQNGLQLIITVLDSDLPIVNGQRQYFPKDEVIRELNDKGDEGRLFKMPAF
ncbi:TPA: DUF2326 domain-containing protein [Vibrio parahaemolyticus]|uniref:DUF2326 domain-containing protein n=1 Tax=Vibrio TaxID=662 RepID=UPI001BD6434F|nr:MULTISPECIES: DUF2326 domain-containing protein [Vibrio]HCG8289267.1 DUF2326 domain-containing protein [Vibrio parahaemolyticus]MBT0025391.1 DUF2326 domain-containing protein [Vibrio alginolyticus]MCS0168064.1 DUF2326 domain-containing protein [Vibrio alginolyticus]MDW1628478.1 DUF2326 domain-containing protein [Vibrio sp. Y176]HCG8294457.1 DUF2326 domain-containing protein [Vibrio parahaemolyticus]